LESFAVLGSSTVTNVPTSTITGNVGVWSPGGANAITGFLSSPGVAVPDPQLAGGLVHAGTSVAQAGQSQLTTAITHLSSMGAGRLLSADLAGLTLAPGTYTVPAGTTNLSGRLTLDGQGNANAGWVFQMASTLITSRDSVVNIVNTGAGAGVYWNVGSSATFDSNSTFLGNVLAVASVTMVSAATDACGRVLAHAGAVTLQQNAIGNLCLDPVGGTRGLGGGLEVTTDLNGLSTVAYLPFAPLSPVPEPETLTLMLLAGLGAALRRAWQVNSLGADPI
jgi:hypothetical protein